MAQYLTMGSVCELARRVLGAAGMNELKTEELKTRRITVRISGSDLETLQTEAQKRNTTLGAVVRDLIRASAQKSSGNGSNGHSNL
jgi:hypothetical protein